MDITQMSTLMAAERYSTQGSILVAKKILDQQEQQGQNAVSLIKQSAPQPDDGKGKLLNIYA